MANARAFVADETASPERLKGGSSDVRKGVLLKPTVPAKNAVPSINKLAFNIELKKVLLGRNYKEVLLNLKVKY